MPPEARQTILIVDDNPDNIRVLLDFLSDEYTLMVATSGERALELVTTGNIPDLILLDVLMPGMNGYQVCEKLQVMPHTSQIPVIFVTGLTTYADEQKGLELGAVDYISKPFRPALVKARLRNHLALKQHRDNLEKLVMQRTAELASLNANLEQLVAEEIKKNNEKDQLLFQQVRLAAMGEMLRNIAHQWRQPLNNVALLLQCAQAECDDGNLNSATYRELVNKCMQDLNYLSETINDFAGFYKIDRQQALFDPCHMVERAVSLLQDVLHNNGIAITMEKCGAMQSYGFGNEFSQAVLNIVTNAMDVLINRTIASPHITIRCSCHDGLNVITVQDNAGGIDEKIVDKIFDPYFTTKFMAQGTGVGLYMSKLIVEKHMNGSCTACNRNGGAEFTISIPAVPAIPLSPANQTP